MKVRSAKSIKRATVSVVVVAVLLGGTISIGSFSQSASALTGSSFEPGNIISDQHFFDSQAMDEAAIQQFLVSKVPTCSSSSAQPCLKSYRLDTTTRAAVTGVCDAYQGAAAELASRIVAKVAQACGINPQVLLATLQKEEGLITSVSPSAGMYKIAMGYGCPDTFVCDTHFYGFYNQVYRAAWQFKQYTMSPSSWRYKVGANAIQYNPKASCGSSIVTITNQATANLYNYTPYQPNAQALNNLGGTGDGCSSYGNRNFWFYFNNWFGPSTIPVNPQGNVDAVTAGVKSVSVAGWTFDPETPAPIDVHIYVDGGWGGAFTANLPRADIAAAFPGYGAFHGFDVTVPVSIGTHHVCAYAINVGAGSSNPLLGCATVLVPSSIPVGNFESVTLSGSSILVTGWAIDQDYSSAVPIDIYLNGVKAGGFSASKARPDVGRAYPGLGADHGFSESIPAKAGTVEVCVHAIDLQGTANPMFGCRSVVIPASTPIGNFESAIFSSGNVTVAGWALDRLSSDPVHVHVYVNGVKKTDVIADGPRRDVGAVYTQSGPNHGFSATVPVAIGSSQVCIYAIDLVGGRNPQLGCRMVVTSQTSPIGNFESAVVSSTGTALTGWALDPDVTDPVAIHVYVNGIKVREYVAESSRPDVGAVYPGYGDKHGFSVTIPAIVSPSVVCIYAIDIGVSPNPILGCRQIG